MPTFSTLIGPLLVAGTILLGAAGSTGESATSDPDRLQTAGLPNCNDDLAKGGRDVSDRLLYVTTLDGRMSALDMTDGGALRWSVETGPGSLLSSSIHRLELTNNGKWVRMIPSLSGGLYKFDGETVEPIPFSAEDLLRSSFKFSDDLVISGGKETRSYGVSTRTGQLIYECTMNGCRNATQILEEEGKSGPVREGMERVLEHDPLLDDVVVIRRQTQTVRAVESRTGNERWNFSIGHHELEMLKNEDCRQGSKEGLDAAVLDVELRVVIPEGVVCAVSKSTPGVVLWRHKFDHPIVSAWRAKDRNGLMSVDLFRGAEWLWNNNGQMGATDWLKDSNGLINPSLYLGMHQKQLYIQESMALMVRQTSDVQEILLMDESKFPTIPWKPFPASRQVAGLLTDGSEPEDDSQFAESTAIARSVLYQSNYVNGNGFFLFTPEDLKRKDNGLCSNKTTAAITDGSRNESSIFDFAMDPDAPVKVIIISIWFWWKEILVISATTAFLLNVMLRFKQEKEKVVVFVERPVEVPVPMGIEATEEAFVPLAAIRNSSRSLSESNGDNFVSRFQEDFELVQCLGKGGFGVVFEVKNKLDDCHYAIKRVVLPNKQESKDRVMREVKTLAHCEHPHIVRYFHAWTETPPPGWQEGQDKIWIERNCLSTSIDIETPTETSPPNSKLIPASSGGFSQATLPEPVKHSSPPWITKLPEPSFSLDHASDSNSCSFIEFRADPQKNASPDESEEDDEDVDDDDDSSFQIEFKRDTQDESEDIVFKEPSQDPSHHIISIHDTSNGKTDNGPHFRKNRKRRQLSLDLNSTGNVIRPTQAGAAGGGGDSIATSSGIVSNKIYLYIQMQLCRKQSLKEWLCLNDLSARREKIVPIFEQIVDAVEYVHLKGLIHRDLKPSNIFFSLDGRIRIGDFGLVTDSSDVQYDIEHNLPAMTAKERHTRQVGTQLYMSPEQLRSAPYDYKVDIYSLGLVLFELLVCFGTEMERICTIKDVRKGRFPDGFAGSFANEHQLLQLMLSDQPGKRPTTFGIKARPPLKRSISSGSGGSSLHLPGLATDQVPPNGSNNRTLSTSSSDGSPLENDEWHFELPPRRKDSRSFTTTNNSNSTGSNQNNQIFF
uniref:non-specific serine/threonine protein kinase n=1 Tax=Culex pipiens TaxID=7175 RepID=A0A8D8BTI2_CULPI